MNIVLLGPPGAGKGTQAKRLQSEYSLPQIASGDIFRAIRRDDTPVARQIQEYMDRGEYVPDQLTIEVVLKRLDEPDARNGFILDGFPRTLPQAAALDRALEQEGRKVNVVLYITAPTDVLVARICDRIICPNCNAIYNAVTKPPAYDMICDNCGHALERRTDEDPEVVRVRLDTYAKQTRPVADYYGERGLLCEIDGTLDMEQVHENVDSCLVGKSAR